MSYYRYGDEEYGREAEWESRFRRACRSQSGFAWGAFLIGLVVGAIIF